MNKLKNEQRELIVKTAKEYLGTPYHHNAKIKGVGVDCLTFIVATFEDSGLIQPVKIPNYSSAWHLHHSQQLYMNGVLQYCKEVENPLPGDIALWQFGRCYSHGAIVVEWPVIIHAYLNCNVMTENVDNAVWLKYQKGGELRPVKYFSFWG